VKDFEGRAREMFVEGNDEFHLRKFNTILTDPPFGANIKVLKSEAAIFKLGHVWGKDATGEWLQTTKDKDTEPQILFVERCLDMLEDGGHSQSFFRKLSSMLQIAAMC